MQSNERYLTISSFPSHQPLRRESDMRVLPNSCMYIIRRRRTMRLAWRHNHDLGRPICLFGDLLIVVRASLISRWKLRCSDHLPTFRSPCLFWIVRVVQHSTHFCDQRRRRRWRGQYYISYMYNLLSPRLRIPFPQFNHI